MNDQLEGSGDSGADESVDPADYFETMLGIDLRTAVETVEREARKIRPGNRSGAQDLAQEVWGNLLGKLDGGSLPTRVDHPEAWLRKVVRNQDFDDYRKAHAAFRAAALPDLAFDDMPLGWEPASPIIGPEDLTLDGDLKERLRVAVAKLPRELQDVVNLIQEGRLHREIAEILGIPVGTSKTRLRRAAKLLRADPTLDTD